MNARVDAYLDGELSRDALTAEEQATADAIRELAAGVRTALHAPPALRVTLLRRIRELGLEPAAAPGAPAHLRAEIGDGVATHGEPRRLRSVLDAAWQPRRVSFRFRPALAAGLAAVIAVAMLTVRGPAPETALADDVQPRRPR